MNAMKSNPKTRPTGVFQFTVRYSNVKNKPTLTYLIKISCAKVDKLVVDIFLTQYMCLRRDCSINYTGIIHFLNINMTLHKIYYMYQGASF